MILQRTVKGKRRRTEEEMEKNIKERTGMDFADQLGQLKDKVKRHYCEPNSRVRLWDRPEE